MAETIENRISQMLFNEPGQVHSMPLNGFELKLIGMLHQEAYDLAINHMKKTLASILVEAKVNMADATAILDLTIEPARFVKIILFALQVEYADGKKMADLVKIVAALKVATGVTKGDSCPICGAEECHH